MWSLELSTAKYNETERLAQKTKLVSNLSDQVSTEDQSSSNQEPEEPREDWAL